MSAEVFYHTELSSRSSLLLGRGGARRSFIKGPRKRRGALELRSKATMVGTSERRDGAHNMGFSECIDTILNGNETELFDPAVVYRT